jgi:hypothetical protein
MFLAIKVKNKECIYSLVIPTEPNLEVGKSKVVGVYKVTIHL